MFMCNTRHLETTVGHLKAFNTFSCSQCKLAQQLRKTSWHYV